MLFGKDKALKILNERYDDVIKQKGSTILITGEAGIGKTTLVEHFLKDKECMKLKGTCLPVITPPLQPFIEALSKHNLEHLILGGKIPKLTMLYVVHSTGLLVSKVERVELGIDTDIFTSMLSAIGMFVKDSFEKISSGEEYLEEIKFGKFNLVMKNGKNFSLVAVVEGKANEFLHKDLEDLKNKISRDFGEVLEIWDGDMSNISSIENYLKNFVYSGKYDGGFVEGSVQEWNFENVRLGLKRITKDKPVCIFIDDIQWADEATLSLIHYLARNTRREKMMIICTYRKREISDELQNFIESVIREDIAEIIKLKPINFEEIISVLKNFLKGNVGVDLVDYVYNKSGGIPLHIVELVRLLQEENLIILKDGTYHISEKKDIVPEKVENIIMRRARKLGDEKDVLEFAAVLGVHIIPEIISCAFNMNRIATLRILRELKEKGFLGIFEDKYRFYHEYVRRIIYDSIDNVMKKEYHKIAAECIENTEMESKVKIPLLVEHYYASENCKMTIEYGKKAAEILVEEYSYRDAIKIYALVYKCASKLGDENIVYESLINMGRLYEETGNFYSALEMYNKAKNTEIKDYRCFLSIGNVYTKMGMYRKAKKFYEKAAKINAPLPEIKSAMGNLSMRTGDLERAEKEFKDYLKWAEDSGDDDNIMIAYKYLGSLYWYKRIYDKALFFYENALRIAKNKNMKKQIADLLHNIGTINYHKGEILTSLKYFQESLKIREKIEDIGGLPLTYNMLGLVYWNIGNVKSATTYFQKALEYNKLLGRKAGEALIYSNLGIMEYYNFDYSSAKKNLTKSVDIFESIGDEYSLMEPLIYLISLYIETGRIDKAEDMLLKAENTVEKLDIEDYKLWLEVVKFTLKTKKGEYSHIDELTESLRDNPLLLAILYRFRWLSLRRKSDFEIAVENFKKANFIAPIQSMRKKLEDK